MYGSSEARAELPEDDPLLGSPSAWTRYEKFNVNFNQAAYGWNNQRNSALAYAVAQAVDSEVSDLTEEREPGQLFLIGRLGDIGDLPRQGSDKLSQTVHRIGQSLELTGEIEICRPKTSIAGTYTQIRQMIDRVPIYGAELTFHADSNGSAYALVGNPAPKGLEVVREANRISPFEAAEIVADGLETTVDNLQFQAEEVLLPVERELYPCYLIRAISGAPFGDWHGFVRHDRKLLALFNVASAAEGRASGYTINPTRSPNIERLLLSELSKSNLLNGPHTEVRGADLTQVTSETGDFFFEDTQDEFDEPQVYYFLEFCRRAANSFVGGKFAPQLSEHTAFNPIKARVHARRSAGNAIYFPDTNEIYFGDNLRENPRRCSSRSLDLVLHEFGHVISHSICKLAIAVTHHSCRAMSEGFSDYFAGTILDDPVVADDFDPQRPRRCDNNRIFPRHFMGEEHEMGEIWAGLLWDLRSEPAIGRDTADTIILQSLTYLGPWNSYFQGVDALVQADKLICPTHDGRRGQHEDFIREAFKNRRAP